MKLMFFVRTLIAIVFLTLGTGSVAAHQNWVDAEVVVKHGSGSFDPNPNVVFGDFARLNCGPNLTAISGGWRVTSDSDGNLKPFIHLTAQVFGPENDEWVFSFNNNSMDINYTITVRLFALCAQK